MSGYGTFTLLGSVRVSVTRSMLLVGVGAALAGIAVVLAMLAVAFQPLLIFFAVPFGIAGYLIWYQGTGRLTARMRRQATRRRARRARRGRPGFGVDTGSGSESDAGPRWADAEFRRQRRRGETASGRRGAFDATTGSRSRSRSGSARTTGRTGMGVEEAYRVLGLSPGSDADAVRDAYREKVKNVHPDAEGGDEESFKRVNEAYETLTTGRHSTQ